MLFSACRAWTAKRWFHVKICDPSREKGPYGNWEKNQLSLPSLTPQADHGQNFSLFTDFL